MKRPSLMLALLGVACLAGAVFGEPAAVSNQLCPVMPDERVDPAIFVTYRGQRVQFCCKRCRKKFLENPSAYLKNLPQIVLAHAADEAGSSEPSTAHGGPAEAVDLDHQEHKAPADDHAHAATAEHAEPAEHAEAEPHDHATGHGQVEGLDRAIRFAGKFHPLVIHFPIALVMGAALAEILALLAGGRFFADAARFGIVLGALGAAGAVPLGWAAGAYANYPDELAFVLTLHRWVGTATGLLIVAACVLSEVSRRSAGGRVRLAYRVLLFASAGLVGLTGFLGGSLIYGLDHFAW